MAILPLKKRAQFLKFRENKHRFVSPFFILEIRPFSEAAPEDLGYGITASKKVGKAVQRSFAKRRARTLFRSSFFKNSPSGYAYHLIARTSLLEAPFSELTTLFEKGVRYLQRKQKDD